MAPPEYSVENLESDLESEDFGGLDLDLDIDLSTEVDLGTEQVKTLSLNETHDVLSKPNGIELADEEVKTILLDTKNSLSDEDIEKKRALKNKKGFSFFNDSVEEDLE